MTIIVKSYFVNLAAERSEPANYMSLVVLCTRCSVCLLTVYWRRKIDRNRCTIEKVKLQYKVSKCKILELEW